MKLLIFVLIMFPFYGCSQTIYCIYNKVGRLIETSYLNQTKVNYTYDKDGNRIQKVESTVVVIPNSISENSNKQIELLLFPNPTSGVINGKFYNLSKQQISVYIYSVTGTIVHSYFFIADVGECIFTFNIIPLASGTYTVKVSSKEKEYTGKIIVE